MGIEVGSINLKGSKKRNGRAVRVFVWILPLLIAAAGKAGAQVEAPGDAEASGRNPSMSASVETPAPSNPSATLPVPALIDAPLPQPAGDPVTPQPPAPPTVVPQDQPGGFEVAPLHTKYILPNQRAQTLAARDKMLIALEDIYSPLNFGGMIAAAGYEQVRNSQPNYGTDAGAFGQRLGAAAIRDTAQGVFTDGIFAPLLHEDPRYYVEGPGYNVVHRALYAVTRPVITRTDSGRPTINGALLLGYAATSVLNNAYYPQVNRNARDNAEAFAGSIGGSALGFMLTEFTSSLWGRFHIGQKH